MKFLAVFGTRPEAVKLAPILLALDKERGHELLVCVTGQHSELVDPALDFFEIRPMFDLEADGARPRRSTRSWPRLVERLDAVLAEAAPDRVIVQGDTTSALAAALAAFHRRSRSPMSKPGFAPIAPREPFPEEFNRRAIGLIADLHFAPTRAARDQASRRAAERRSLRHRQ